MELNPAPLAPQENAQTIRPWLRSHVLSHFYTGQSFLLNDIAKYPKSLQFKFRQMVRFFTNSFFVEVRPNN